jgi:perosamine synthetase
MNTRILYAKPSITAREVSYATDAAANGWGDRCYDYIHRFEAAFRAHLDVPYAIATSSCTGALHIGLAALGIVPGDEVILPDTDWIGSVAPITYLGATPVFVDVESDSWCIDPGRAEAAITPRTRAILAVHLYGNMCDMSALLAVGARHGIPIVEDAAEAIGSAWQGGRAGATGTFGTFSFHGTKTVTTGEGGMFVTNDLALYERVLTLSNHGRARGQTRQFWADRIGFKYKMSNLQAAIGVGQMERIDELIARKRAIFARYRENLARYSGITLNPEPEGTRNGYWMPTAVFAPETGVTRERLQAAFAAANIDARVFFWPLTGMPAFQPVPANTNAYDLPGRAINLPSYHDMTDGDIGRVSDVVVNTLLASRGTLDTLRNVA